MLYAVKSSIEDLPQEYDWTNDRSLVLKQLLFENKTVLFEKEIQLEKIKGYQQYSLDEIDNLMESRYQKSCFNKIQRTLNTKEYWGLYNNAVVGHGNEHGNAVAWLCTIMATQKKLSTIDTILLILAGIFHDVGRAWSNLNDSHHGTKSFDRLAKSLRKSSIDLKGICEDINQLLKESLNFLKLLRENDINILKHIISIHSLDESEKEEYQIKYNLSMNGRFLLLGTIFDDCDALDRSRFGLNLDIKFLRDNSAKRLIQYAADIHF